MKPADPNPVDHVDRTPDDAGGPLLRCRGLTYRYPGGEAPVLNDLNLEISTPGFHGLFGPSGVGKTSLARIAAGLLTGFSGRVHGAPETRILYTFNLERLPGWSPIGTHLDRITPPGRANLRRDLVAACGLTDLLGQRFSQLSLGQQNRINLVRYLLQDFDLLIMDESLANVDEATRGAIIAYVKKRFPHTGFLYISHNVVEVARYCRQIVVCRSPGKHPQAVTVQGLDQTAGAPESPRALEAAMVEIINAA